MGAFEGQEMVGFAMSLPGVKAAKRGTVTLPALSYAGR
jgi:hypothetical protein